jgi:hypothetical protein
MTNSVCEAVNNLVMSDGNCRHVGGAMTEDMRKCFVLFTVKTGVRPSMFHSADGEAVEASSMDESPILKMKVEAGEVPVGAISKLVVGERERGTRGGKNILFSGTAMQSRKMFCK